jgi:hypothetical protein
LKYGSFRRMLRIHSMLSSGKLHLGISSLLLSIGGIAFGILGLSVVICLAGVGLLLIVTSGAAKTLV